MKKFVSGIVVGALLMTGASAFANSVGLSAGQKVQGLYSIEKGGSKVADAAIINGSAYVPVRPIAEATGTKLTVEGKKIIMGDTAASGSNTLLGLQTEREKVVDNITRLEGGILDSERNILPGLRDQAEILSTNGAIGERAKSTLAEHEKQVQSEKAELTALRAQLAELDAQIATLSK